MFLEIVSNKITSMMTLLRHYEIVALKNKGYFSKYNLRNFHSFDHKMGNGTGKK